MRYAIILLSGALVGCSGCDDPPPKTALDYTDDARWAALPSTDDPADRVPPAEGIDPTLAPTLVDGQPDAPVDVFYVHPTTWIETLSTANATLDDGAVNAETDATLRYQASAFNYAGRVFAPRYRQASLITYVDDIGDGAEAVIDAAYRDVEAAFDDFLRRIGDRRFIVAGHSQGASHLVRLLKARLDGTPLGERLVAAYLVGELVGDDTFTALRPCAAPDATGCVMTWATAREGAEAGGACGSSRYGGCIPSTVNTRQTPWCTDPIGGRAGGASPAEAARGAGPGRGLGSGAFDRLYRGLVATRCVDGILRVDDSAEVDGVSAADFPDVGDGDYHAQDVNLFWLDVRVDAARRAGRSIPGE